MPPASSFLLLGAVLATVLCVAAWLIRRPSRAPRNSVEAFRKSLSAMAPNAGRRP